MSATRSAAQALLVLLALLSACAPAKAPPASTRLTSSIVPPAAATISRQIASPRPEPWRGPPAAKGWNSRWRCSSVMPGPSSSTCSRS